MLLLDNKFQQTFHRSFRDSKMTANLEQTILEKFRKLPVEKQKDILDLLDFMESGLSDSPTDLEVENARKTLNAAKEKAQSASPKPATELWGEFNRIKTLIAEDYLYKLRGGSQ